MDDLVKSDLVGTPDSVAAQDEGFQSTASNDCSGGEDSKKGSTTSSNVHDKTSCGALLQNVIVSLPSSTLIHPRSAFERSEDLNDSEGFSPPAPVAAEWDAIQSLLQASSPRSKERFVQFELEDFCCYVDIPRYPVEMRALHDHATRTGAEHFYFDGVLRVGDVRHYVQKVRFDQIPLGNYGLDLATGRYDPTVGDQMWVLSRLNEKRNKFPGQAREGIDVYYQLGKPSIEYARYHNAFLWVADLAKHVVDFCDHRLKCGKNVSIHDFKSNFSEWMRETHQKSPPFLKWYEQRGCDDFRQSIIANEGFISKEVFGVLGDKSRGMHLFREIAAPFGIYERAGVATWTRKKKAKVVSPTIVTPYIYECFSRLRLGQLLKPVKPCVSTEEAIRLSWPQNPHKSLPYTCKVDKCRWQNRQDMLGAIRPGDIISTPPDEKDSGTMWMTSTADKKWFGLVQKTCRTGTGNRLFDVIWLYQPDDTPCCSMKYPWVAELFLGNNCTCDQALKSKIAEDQVIDVHSVEWFGTPRTQAEFFVRQTYLTEERRFVTLEPEHLTCEHNGQAEHAPKYCVGDTVLIRLPGSSSLEPCELLEVDVQEIRLRTFRRRREYTDKAAPNELVYTNDKTCALMKQIAARCIIRFYSSGETIPAPYNRNGAGNAFFITCRLLEDGSLGTLGPDRPNLRQGFDPEKQEEKLRALDLFCGCGNFGRGLEDGGAVRARWTNDIWETAVHTYMANTEPGSMSPFLGSIDDLLELGLKGQFSETVPQPGQVDVISGGSPCPGFSLVTPDKTTLEQMKNRSLIASFASCIDFWRPRWGILENVKTIVQSSKNRTEDFFSQLICAIVGMGYQAQIILGDAWSHGNPQMRVRAFLCFAAPGVRLPNPPYPSHSNPKMSGVSSNLGMMTNGEPYVSRSDRPTAFRYVSLAESTADLPDVYDSKPDTCVPFPDHRLSIAIGSGNVAHRNREGSGKNRRAQVLNIPTRPYGMNFARAHHVPRTEDGEPDMFPHERDSFPSSQSLRTSRLSRGWGRAHPHGLLGTVTTVCAITDARVGGSLMHWDQPRPLTIMEARRAQGVPDDEVLCGKPADQWAMVGNGVARGISTALGLSLREAWRGTLYEDAEGEVLHERDGTDVTNVPWLATPPLEERGQDDETQGRSEDELEDIVALDSRVSVRAASQMLDMPRVPTLAVATPPIAPARLSSMTTATSLTLETQSAGEVIATAATACDTIERNVEKRPLTETLADEDLSTSSFKRARLSEEQGEVEVANEAMLQADKKGEDSSLLTASEEDIYGGMSESEVYLDDEVPMRTSTGATVVRLSLEDLLDHSSC